MARPVTPVFAAEVWARGGATAGFAHAAACRKRRSVVVFAAEVVPPAGFAAELSGRSAASLAVLHHERGAVLVMRLSRCGVR